MLEELTFDTCILGFSWGPEGGESSLWRDSSRGHIADKCFAIYLLFYKSVSFDLSY